ncbi:hypothetical protein ATANTOWER_003664 [Ataeniobius toweri]|uniref:Beta-adaptin appendage C-terminal subdomain domain-containing protein n=1 Tax=Ataeniobius toweri TaxID=208326 RepID=A0ABU7AP48_9TELE|nr:hypothetical protein [Ataeniobius toweri]
MPSILTVFHSLSSPGSDYASQRFHCSAGLMSPGTEPRITLSLSPSVSPEEFQRLWMQRQALLSEQVLTESAEGDNCMWIEETIKCTAVPHCSPQSLHAAMQLVNIQTLAFTPSHALPWKVFLYTHTLHADTSCRTLVLGELLYTGEETQNRSADGEVKVKEQMEADGDKEIKVTLRQHPQDVRALRAFLSVLSTVLHTLSSEMAEIL